MANSENTSDVDYADKLWQAADKLRGTVDAAEYKYEHIVLGLLFSIHLRFLRIPRVKLKEELEKDGIKGEHLERLLENRDEYTAERVFWVPTEARWHMLVEMLKPYQGRVYDPCCGSGGMFVQSEQFVEAHSGNTRDISICDQEEGNGEMTRSTTSFLFNHESRLHNPTAR